jgi:hypothetical protein
MTCPCKGKPKCAEGKRLYKILHAGRVVATTDDRKHAARIRKRVKKEFSKKR